MNNFKSIFLSITFILTLSIFVILPITSYAAEKNEMVKIEKENGELTLIIQEIGDYYKIFKDKKLVYEGQNNIYKDSLDNETKKYKVGIFEKNKLKKVVSLKVSNNSKQKINFKNTEESINTIIKDTKLETSVSDNSVTLQWPILPDKDKIYEIYRDDQKIAETKELYYIDTNIKPNTEYTYTLKVDNEVSEKTKKEIKAKAQIYNVKLTKENEEELFTYSGTITTVIKTSNNTEESLKTDELMDPLLASLNNDSSKSTNEATFTAAAVPKENEFSIDYRTFIPYKSVKNPNPLSSVEYLQGDNRSSFQTYSDKYRTESSVYAMFKNPTSLTLWKDVHGTYSCADASCSNPKYVDTASSNGITLSKYQETSTKLQWSVNHNVGIPLGWFYPAISYYYLASLTPTSFGASGEHDKAPNHEMYITYPSGSQKIHTYAVSSELNFLALFGVQTTWSFDM